MLLFITKIWNLILISSAQNEVEPETQNTEWSEMSSEDKENMCFGGNNGPFATAYLHTLRTLWGIVRFDNLVKYVNLKPCSKPSTQIIG